MTITPDSSSPPITSGFSNPIQTDQFSPPAGSTLVAYVVDTSADNRIFTLSNTGTALSWQVGKRFERVAIYTAYNANAQSNIRVSFATNGSPTDVLILKVVVWNGVDSSSPVASNNAGSSSSNFVEPWLLSTTVDNSRVTYIADDSHGSGNLDPGSPDTTFEYNSSGKGSGLAAYKTANTSPSGTAVFGYLDAAGAAVPFWRWAVVELRPSTTQTIIPTGISSGEAFGTAKINLTVSPTGIASGEAVGTPTLALQNLIIAQGIASQEALGTPTLIYSQIISPSGITSGETFGTPTIQLGYPQTVQTVGIPSEEIVSDGLVVKLRHRIVFRPPSVQERPAARNVLLVRFGIHRGITVIKRHDGTFYETRYPDQVTVEEAERVYWGGHVNEISAEDYLALSAAGYGSYLSVEAIE